MPSPIDKETLDAIEQALDQVGDYGEVVIQKAQGKVQNVRARADILTMKNGKRTGGE